MYVPRSLPSHKRTYSDQIDHRHPEVQEDFLRWGPWMLEVRPQIPSQSRPIYNIPQTLGAAGFRIDAAKHIDYKFMLQWVRVRAQPDGARA